MGLKSGKHHKNQGRQVQYGTATVTNALFHILHDFGGTEAGVLIFTWLVYQKALVK